MFLRSAGAFRTPRGRRGPIETFAKCDKTSAGFCSVPDGDMELKVGGTEGMNCSLRRGVSSIELEIYHQRERNEEVADTNTFSNDFNSERTEL